jgi:hypothetical protein
MALRAQETMLACEREMSIMACSLHARRLFLARLVV